MSSARFEPKEGDENGKKKIRIARITLQKSRQVTFNKRKVGLMKKAMELSILCECEIAVILFDHQKQLYQYSTRPTANGMEQLIQRWKDYDGNYEALTNADLQTLKPGRAASFRVGKKRKSSGGKAVPAASNKRKADAEAESEEEDDDDDDEDGTAGSNADATETRHTSTYKHTTTHPLHSPSSSGTADFSQLKGLAHPASMAHVPITNPTLANTSHPLMTPLGTPHSFAALLSPTSALPSASSMGAGTFGSAYPFNHASATPLQTPSTLQQVLHSQSSLLSPNGAGAPFSSTTSALAGLTPTQIEQLSQQIQQHQMQQQQQQQQQQFAAALSQQQQQQLQENMMSKMLQQQQQQFQQQLHQPMPSASSAAYSMSRAPASIVGSHSSHSASGLSAMLSPAIPPSPGIMFNAPITPAMFNSNSYGQFMSHQQQQANVNAANMQHQQYQQMQHQQQQQMSAAAHSTSALNATSMTSSLSASPNSASSGMHLLSSTAGSSIDGLSGLASAALPSSSSTSAGAAGGSTIPASASVGTSSSSSSSLLSKRAPFKAALSLEIPTKPNVAGGVDITQAAGNAVASSAPSQQQQGTTDKPNIDGGAATGPSRATIKQEVHAAAAAAAAAVRLAPPAAHQIPVSAPAQGHTDGSSMSMSLPAHPHPMSAYTNMQLGYSPLTSPSAFLAGDQQQAAMLFAINGGMSGMAVTGQANAAAVAAAAAAAAAATSHPSQAPSQSPPSAPTHPGVPTAQHLQPPMSLSPYGQWNTTFSHAMDNGPKLYSPTALRSPAAAAALFARNFQ